MTTETGSIVSLRDYVDILHRRRWIVIGAFVIALAVAVAMSLLMPAVYQASTTVTMDKTPPVLLTDRQGQLVSMFSDKATSQTPDVATLAELIRSDAVREGAVASLAASVGPDAAQTALRGLSVEPVRGTALLRVSVAHSDPRIAAQAANAVSVSLVDMSLRMRRRLATDTREFIGRQLEDARIRLRDAENALVVFRSRNGEVSLAQETTLNLQQLADLQAQLVDAGLQRNTARTRIATARDRLTRQAKLAPTQWTPSPLIASLQEQLVRLEIDLSGLRREFTPRHPTVISAQAKIEETKRRLQAELAKSLSPGAYGVDPIYQQTAQDLAQAEIGLTILGSRERALRAAIVGYAQRVRDVPTREVELARVTREVREAEQIYLLLSEKFQDARIAEASIGGSISIVAPAKAPSSPIRPRRQMNTLFGALLGLFAGMVGAFLVELVDDTVKSADDVERALGAPVLGAIPLVNGTKPSGNGQTHSAQALVLPRDGNHLPASEAYRVLRTHLLFAMPDLKHKRVLVTSALPREGKSTVAVNLAMAVARSDRKVWLVDSDLRRSTLSRAFSDADSPGLATLLAGQVEVDVVVRPSGEPNLWFVGSGPSVPNPAELLGAQSMGRLLERAREQADLVLLDSPPVLPVTDAEVAAAHADGVLLVVKVGETTRRALAHTRRRLSQVGARTIGAVLNFVPGGRHDGYYYEAYYGAYDGSQDRGNGTGPDARRSGDGAESMTRVPGG